MTFYYDEDADELIGNNMFYEDHDMAEHRGDTLAINVEWIMEEGRGLSKLREIRDSVDAAIEAHDE